MVGLLIGEHAGTKASNLRVERLDDASKEQDAVGPLTLSVESVAHPALPDLVPTLQRADEGSHVRRVVVEALAPSAIQRVQIAASRVGKRDTGRNVASDERQEKDGYRVHADVQQFAREGASNTNIAAFKWMAIQ